MATPGHERLDALTSLRFFAALHVVFLHGGTRLFHGAPRWMENVRACGYASVSFFFVLSGFILTYNYVDPARSERLGVRRFWRARFSRIYPVYFLALAFLGAVSVAIYGAPFLYRQVASGLASLLLVQAWFPHYAMKWNFPGWSISTEAFFYLVFPFVARLLRRDLSRRVLLVLAASCWFASLAVSACSAGLGPDEAIVGEAGRFYWSTGFACHPFARLPEFLAGACLGRIFVADRSEGRGRDGTLMAIAGAAGALLLFAVSASIPGPLVRSVAVPFFALLIFGCAHGARGLGRVLSHPALVALGDASYSLYILQLPVALTLLLLAGSVPALPEMSGALFVVDVGVLVAVSLGTWRFVERPAQRWLRGRVRGTFAGRRP